VKARRFVAKAKCLGMKADARDYWVMEKTGMSDSDPRQLRRLLKVSYSKARSNLD